jgi:hypothetical protein
MSRVELILELSGIDPKTGLVTGTGIESTVEFEINSVVGSRMLTVLGSDRSSESSEEVSSSELSGCNRRNIGMVLESYTAICPVNQRIM